MKRTVKGLWRFFLCDPLPLKAAFTAVMLFAAVPTLHAYIGGYIRVFLVWGAAVAVNDLVCGRRVFRQRGWWLLALFTLSYCLTVFLNRGTTAISVNLSGLLYMLLFFFVLYPSGPEEAERELPVLARVFTAVTALLCIACLVTYLWDIRYVDQTGESPVVIGVYENRLYGLYNCNTGSTLNMLSSLFSVLLLRRGVKRWEKICLSVNLALQYICLVLTLSRAAWYMYLVCAVLTVYLMLPRLPLGRRWLAEGTQALLAVAAAGLLLLLSGPVKLGMAYLPPLIRTAGFSVSAALGSSSPYDGTPTSPVPAERIEDFNKVSVFSEREKLWEGGWETIKEHPLFGVSGAGLYDGAAPHTDKSMWRHLKRGGLHNMPLTVLVCSGGVGAAVMALFLILVNRRVLRAVWRRRGTGAPVIGVGILLAGILGCELMEARLLYSTTVFGCVFWILQGYAVSLAEARNEAA